MVAVTDLYYTPQLQHTREAAEGIIADHLGCERTEVTEAFVDFRAGRRTGQLYGIDLIALLALFEALMPMILQLIEQCQTPNRNRITRRIRRPSRRQRWAFRDRCDVALADLEQFNARDVADVSLEYARWQSRSAIRRIVDEALAQGAAA